MIRTKLDMLKEARNKACFALEEALATKRGTREARIDAEDTRQYAFKTQTCSCCGRHDGVWIGLDGYCKECTANIKRMLVFKSLIKNEWPKAKRLSRFIEDYEKSPNLPYSLRGCMPREEILSRAKALLAAIVEYDEYSKKMEAKR